MIPQTSGAYENKSLFLLYLLHWLQINNASASASHVFTSQEAEGGTEHGLGLS